LAKMGRPKSDEPKSARITVRFSEDEYSKLKKCADNENQTIAQFIRKAVKDVIDSDS